MQQNDIQLVLQDVRKAYRLISSYQQKLIELLDFIKDKLGAEHYYYHTKYSRIDFSKKSFYHEQNFSKKILPMLDMHLLWQKTYETPEGGWWQEYVKSQDLVFDVKIISDDGFDNLKSAEESNSVLQIYIYQCVKYHRDKYWYNDVWCKSEYPLLGEIGEYKNDEKQIHYKIYGEELNLAKLYNEQTVLEVLEEFRKRASDKLGQEI